MVVLVVGSVIIRAIITLEAMHAGKWWGVQARPGGNELGGDWGLDSGLCQVVTAMGGFFSFPPATQTKQKPHQEARRDYHRHF